MFSSCLIFLHPNLLVRCAHCACAAMHRHVMNCSRLSQGVHAAASRAQQAQQWPRQPAWKLLGKPPGQPCGQPEQQPPSQRLSGPACRVPGSPISSAGRSRADMRSCSSQFWRGLGVILITACTAPYHVAIACRILGSPVSTAGRARAEELQACCTPAIPSITTPGCLGEALLLLYLAACAGLVCGVPGSAAGKAPAQHLGDRAVMAGMPLGCFAHSLAAVVWQ